MNLDQLDDTWKNLKEFKTEALTRLEDHISEMLVKIQGSEDKEEAQYWSDLSVIVKSILKERSITV